MNFHDYFRPEELGKEFAELCQFTAGGVPTAAFGLPFSAKCHFLAELPKKSLFIVTDALAAQKAELLICQFGASAVFLYPKDDVLLYKKSFGKESIYRRLSALYEIEKGAKVVVATFESLLQLFPKKFRYTTVKRGAADLTRLESELLSLGYLRRDAAMTKGTFTVRGDILDIFPINSDAPYRIDFYFDDIEHINSFDAETREKTAEVNSIDIPMARDAFLSGDETANILIELNKELKSYSLGALTRARFIAGEIERALDSSGDEELSFIMPLLSSSGDISDYLGDRSVVFDEPKLIRDNLDFTLKEHAERFTSLKQDGEVFDFSYKQYLGKEELLNKLGRQHQLAFQSIGTDAYFFSPLKIINFKALPAPRYSQRTGDLAQDLKSWTLNGYTSLVFAENVNRAENLRASLFESGVPIGEKVKVIPEKLDSGFIYHFASFAVIGSGDIFLRTENKRIKKKRGDVFYAPDIGDYAVHEVHGIGVVRGIKQISTTYGTRDYLSLEYRGGDMLYVPVEQMDDLSVYLGGDKPEVSKIGGDFEKIKARARESIRKMAIDLKALYKTRSEREGYIYRGDDELYKAFDDAFPYEETEDQLATEKEILADMKSGKVMDRLVCGDVGFGKTEIAFRAAFLAIIDKKQVAMLAPTTILSEQHYRTAIERFKGFGVNIEVLNRFKTDAETKDIIWRLKSGEIDFIIGTHKLLGKTIGFKNLGLLILDEEQRFGVEHKESIKLLKSNVDTLTLSATPIPRTLNMSLTGIRDISTINTPPKERVPVQTYVVEETDALIRDAVRRELSRDGQVFILYNRVQTIYHFAERITRLLPDAKISVLHGQMKEKSLEDGIMKFYEGENNVLISTTIIENGIDLPRANTLIVIDSDLMGLSQLYQLKGRVGRSNRLAHAYFTYKREKVLSEEAYKRLSAIMEFTEMGSGIKIAMRDLEIRGAGNVLGAEQHGHMDKIGYELYYKLLKEEMGEEETGGAEIEIALTAVIPDYYISSNKYRIDAYKEIASVRDDEDCARVRDSLISNYGALPREVDNLILVALARQYGKRFKAEKLFIDDKECRIELKSMEPLKDGAVMDRVDDKKYGATLSLAGSKPSVLLKPEKTVRATLEKLLSFLRI